MSYFLNYSIHFHRGRSHAVTIKTLLLEKKVHYQLLVESADKAGKRTFSHHTTSPVEELSCAAALMSKAVRLFHQPPLGRFTEMNPEMGGTQIIVPIGSEFVVMVFTAKGVSPSL